jgi:hypothetical protein
MSHQRAAGQNPMPFGAMGGWPHHPFTRRRQHQFADHSSHKRNARPPKLESSTHGREPAGQGHENLVPVEDVYVDAGLIVNALAASGAFSAAAAAVWVATTDRRQRQQERDTENDAQARLVVVAAQCRENPLELQITVQNAGTRAILDVTFVRIVVDGHDLDLQPTAGPFPSPIVTPGSRALIVFNPAGYGPAHPYYIAIRGGPNGEARTITTNTRVTGTIRWTDASGKTWERWGSGPWLTGTSESGVSIALGTPVQIRA